MKSKIIVAYHKRYEAPKNQLYIPLQVGKANSKVTLDMMGDNQGKNISSRNASFCELTGHYWAFKNLKADTYGLVHYRRYFKSPSSNKLFIKGHPILDENDLDHLKNFDVLLPKKRNFYIMTIDKHYQSYHFQKDWIILEKVMRDKFPEYLNALNIFANQTCMHEFNMFVMKKKYFFQYSRWLFEILFELEKKIDIKNYDAYQKRIFGFLGERLLNIWIIHHQQSIKIKELDTINLEKKLVDHVLDSLSLLKRKYF